MDPLLSACSFVSSAGTARTDGGATLIQAALGILGSVSAAGGDQGSVLLLRHFKAISGAAAVNWRRCRDLEESQSLAAGSASPPPPVLSGALMLLRAQRVCAAVLTLAGVVAAGRMQREEAAPAHGRAQSLSSPEFRELLNGCVRVLQEQLDCGGELVTPRAAAIALLCCFHAGVTAFPAVFRRVCYEGMRASLVWGQEADSLRPVAAMAMAAALSVLSSGRKASSQQPAGSSSSSSSLPRGGENGPPSLALTVLTSVDDHIGALRAQAAGMVVTLPDAAALAATLCGLAAIPGGGAPLPPLRPSAAVSDASNCAVVASRIQILLGALRGMCLHWSSGGGADASMGAGAPGAAQLYAFPVPAALACVSMLADVAGLQSLGMSPPAAVAVADASLSLLDGLVEVLGVRALRFRVHTIRCFLSVLDAAPGLGVPLVSRLLACSALLRLARAGGMGLAGPECTASLRAVVRVAAGVLLGSWAPGATTTDASGASIHVVAAAAGLLQDVVACRGELLGDAVRLTIERTALAALDCRGRGVPSATVAAVTAAAPSGVAAPQYHSDDFALVPQAEEEDGQGVKQRVAAKSSNARYFAGAAAAAQGKSGQSAPSHSPATAGMPAALARQPARNASMLSFSESDASFQLLPVRPGGNQGGGAASHQALPASTAQSLAALLVQCVASPWSSGARSPLINHLHSALHSLGYSAGAYACSPPSLLEYVAVQQHAAPLAALEAEAARLVQTVPAAQPDASSALAAAPLEQYAASNGLYVAAGEAPPVHSTLARDGSVLQSAAAGSLLESASSSAAALSGVGGPEAAEVLASATAADADAEMASDAPVAASLPRDADDATASPPLALGADLLSQPRPAQASALSAAAPAHPVAAAAALPAPSACDEDDDIPDIV